MKAIIIRAEINKSKDAVCVKCPNCEMDIAYVTTSTNADNEVVEKLFKNGNKYYEKCAFCGVELEWGKKNENNDVG
jgi:endogenous inhibitor of DNA gyrase (YacG/DUF329 family)